MNKTRKLFSVLLLVLLQFVVHAQTVVNPDSADMMRSNGKIYVVVAIVLTILLGLFFYLVNLDRKISKMEKKA
jgi:hypothetical protein